MQISNMKISPQSLVIGCSVVTVVCGHNMISMLWGNTAYSVMWWRFVALFEYWTRWFKKMSYYH